MLHFLLTFLRITVYFSMQKTWFLINPKYYANFVCTWNFPFLKFFEILLKILFDACNRIIQNIRITKRLIDQAQVQLFHQCPTNIDSLNKMVTWILATEYLGDGMLTLRDWRLRNIWLRLNFENFQIFLSLSFWVKNHNLIEFLDF